MARKPPLISQGAEGTAGATRASAVYEQLRADITHGVLEPGAKLRVGAMGERYGVGASPLREALNRLSAEGLVARTDQRGFSVAALSWDELPILTRNRVQLAEDPRYLRTGTTLKHAFAYSLEDYHTPSGEHVTRENFNAVVNAFDLHDTYFPHFRAAVLPVAKGGGGAVGVLYS